MSFLVLTIATVIVGMLLLGLAIFIPRAIYAGRLHRQLRGEEGHLFTPDAVTWHEYLARTATATPLVTLSLYAAVIVVIFATQASQVVLAGTVTLGVYLLLRYLLGMLPPTFGITMKGITILSWLPNYPLGPFGSGSLFIPWDSVEICAIDNLFFTILTDNKEAKIVYPPEVEDKVCAFVDNLLRQQGYNIDLAKQ